MPGISGIDMLESIMAQAPTVPVVVITAFAEIELAVRAEKAGIERPD